MPPATRRRCAPLACASWEMSRQPRIGVYLETMLHLPHAMQPWRQPRRRQTTTRSGAMMQIHPEKLPVGRGRALKLRKIGPQCPHRCAHAPYAPHQFDQVKLAVHAQRHLDSPSSYSSRPDRAATAAQGKRVDTAGSQTGRVKNPQLSESARYSHTHRSPTICERHFGRPNPVSARCTGKYSHNGAQAQG